MKPVIELKPINVDAKNRLAKILAAENIAVEFSATAKAAEFNVRSRVLTLPNWDIKDEDVYDLLIAHEVGHALYTPMHGWDKFSLKHQNDPTKLAILHLVEDARIEKLMRRKYQGLRLTFPRGYRSLNADNYFGINGKSLDRFSLPDRLNLFAKMGFFLNVPFEQKEVPFINAIEELETWDDSLDLAERLIKDMEEKNQQKQQDKKNQKSESGSGDGKPESKEDGDSNEADSKKGSEKKDDKNQKKDDASKQKGKPENDDESDDDESDGSDGDGEGDGDQESEVGAVPNIDDFAKKSKGQKTEGEGEGDGEGQEGNDGEKSDDTGVSIPSVGGLFAGRNIVGHELKDTGASVSTQASGKQSVLPPPVRPKTGPTRTLYVDPMGNLHHTAFVPWSNFVPAYEKSGSRDVYSEMFTSMLPQVNYMFKEFETKKRAREFRRINPSRKGGLDMGKIHRYKFDDQIFLTKTTELTGKNHGVVVLVDFSGSMQNVIGNVIEQVQTLTAFFRKAKIKYEIIGFSDSVSSIHPCMKVNAKNVVAKSEDLRTKPHVVNTNMRLVNILSSKMTLRQHKAAINTLKETISSGSYGRGSGSVLGFGLGGTPLDESVAAMASYISEYRMAEKIDIVHFITITDGQSGSVSVSGTAGNSWYYDQNGTVITDIRSKKRYVVPQEEGRYMTASLYRMLRDVHQMNVIGFFLTGNSRPSNDTRRWAENFGYVKSLNKDIDKVNYAVECGGQSITFFIDNETLRKTTNLKESFLRIFIDLIAK